jgi:hypothetical protein
MPGFIKLYRKLLENPIMKQPELLQLWIYCLLKANHEPDKIIFNNSEIIIARGQFLTGRFILAKDLKQNPKSTYNRLRLLKKLDFLDIKTSNKYSIVTIVNYDLYQTAVIIKDNKMDNQRTTKGQQTGHKQEDIKNDKNDKKVLNTYSDSLELDTAINDFLEMRKLIKAPMTSRAIKNLLIELDKLDKTVEGKIAILNQSINRSWKGVFPLKTNQQQNESGNVFFNLMDKGDKT